MRDRALQFWMYNPSGMNYDEPSIGFGDWHTHLGNSMEELLDLADAIRADKMVEYFVLDWDPSHWWVFGDLRNDYLLDLLADPSSSGRIRVRSWGGTKGRRIWFGRPKERANKVNRRSLGEVLKEGNLFAVALLEGEEIEFKDE